MSDLNMVVLAGRLAADPEVKTFESGARVTRLLVTVRADHPRRRVDVVPVTVWDSDDGVVVVDPGADCVRGERVVVSGTVQRRFWESGSDGRRSRLEVVASEVHFLGAPAVEVSI